MNEAQNLDLSLLSQYEVDTLVNFLLEKKDTVDSSVLSQKSVDKLIELLRYDKHRRKQELVSALPDLERALADAVTVRENARQLCELCCEVGGADGFLKLSVMNKENGQAMQITPTVINSDDDAEWGRCMAPATFCRLASALGVKYTTDTYEAVCKQFAECMFGDAECKIPFLYLPSNAEMLKGLI